MLAAQHDLPVRTQPLSHPLPHTPYCFLALLPLPSHQPRFATATATAVRLHCLPACNRFLISGQSSRCIRRIKLLRSARIYANIEIKFSILISHQLKCYKATPRASPPIAKPMQRGLSWQPAPGQAYPLARKRILWHSKSSHVRVGGPLKLDVLIRVRFSSTAWSTGAPSPRSPPRPSPLPLFHTPPPPPPQTSV